MYRDRIRGYSLLSFKVLCIILLNLIFLFHFSGKSVEVGKVIHAEEDFDSDVITDNEDSGEVIGHNDEAYPTPDSNIDEGKSGGTDQNSGKDVDPSQTPDDNNSSEGNSGEPNGADHTDKGNPDETDDQNTTDTPDVNDNTNESDPPDDEEIIPAIKMQKEINKLYRHREDKVAYLTFDDGPSPKYTAQILDILAQEDIKATFFVIGDNAERHPELIVRQYEEGHGIGLHTYTHVFKHIYASTDNYLNELKASNDLLRSILGQDKDFMLTRFPGGSFGKKLEPFREAVNEAGYIYIDWNCVNGDAETVKIRSAQELFQRFLDTVNSQTSLIILMHDAANKSTTVEALPEIISYLKTAGYRFELLPWARGTK